MYKLNQIPLNSECVVYEVDEEGVGLRLMEMGLVPGTPVKRILNAPGGCPLAILVDGSSVLGLRRDEAELVTVYFTT
jgi:ferrous iron transport protein A